MSKNRAGHTYQLPCANVFAVKDPQTVSKVRKRGEFHHPPPKHMYRLPDPWVVQHATHRMQREGKMWRTLHATAIGVLLLALLVAIAYGNTDRCSFFINKSIIDTFVKARHSGDSPLMKVLYVHIYVIAFS